MCKLSIIVPAAGSQELIDETLLGVLENRPDHCEVIVTHAPGYSDPYDLADEVRFVQTSTDDLASLINDGVSSSQADIVHILHGVRATAEWTTAPVELLERNSKLSAIAPLVVNSADRTSHIVSAGIRCLRSGQRKLVGAGKRCRENASFTADGPALQAAFWIRADFMELGGYRNCFGPDLLDADLAARLQLADMKCQVACNSRLIGQPTKTTNGYQAARLAEQFYQTLGDLGYPTSRVTHAAHVVWETVSQFPSPKALATLAGRLRGWLAGAVDEELAPLVEAYGDHAISLPFEQRNHRPDSDGQQYAKSA